MNTVKSNRHLTLGRIDVDKEATLHMDQKEIIFFDELGFGWIVDKAVVKKIHATSPDEEIIVQKTLADLLRRA